METPLRFLREWLPFSRPPGSDRTVAEVRAWLDNAGEEPALQAVGTLATQIVPTIGRQEGLQQRFRLLEETRAEIDRSLPLIERQVEQSDLPLPTAAATAALAADNLLKVLAIAYSGIAHGIHSQKLTASHSQLLESSVRRAMQAVCRRQQLAYRACATPSANSWQMLHELYRLARSQRVSTRNGSETPIEYLYASALLLALVDPNKFPRGSLDQVRACTDQLGPLATLTEVNPDFQVPKNPGGQFAIRGDEGGPGRPLLRAPTMADLAGCLIADFRPALAVLDQHLRALPGDTPALSLEAPEALLRGLRSAIGNHAARRFSRTRFKPRADLISGIDALIEFLNGRALSRRSNDPHRRGQKWPLAIGEWALLDESPEGYGVRFIKGEKSRIETGEIVGLQPRENSKLHICIVRRVASPQHHRLELGLQELSANALVIDLPVSDGATRQAILIPHLPGHGNCAAVLAPPGLLRSGQRINFRDPQQAVRFAIGAPLEKTPHLELFALDRLAG